MESAQRPRRALRTASRASAGCISTMAEPTAAQGHENCEVATATISRDEDIHAVMARVLCCRESEQSDGRRQWVELDIVNPVIIVDLRKWSRDTGEYVTLGETFTITVKTRFTERVPNWGVRGKVVELRGGVAVIECEVLS